MTPTIVTLTCPSCGISKELPLAIIPRDVVNATCRACGHQFPLAGHLQLPPAPISEPDFQFEVISSPPTPTTAEKTVEPEKKPATASFVDVVAWISIAICGFATLISILQNVMVNTLFPLEEMQKGMTAQGMPEMPSFFRFMFGNFRLLIASMLVVCIAMLTASVGLLKRKNWARILFIAILSLGILWNLVGMVLQFSFMQDFPPMEGAPAEFATTFTTVKSVIMVISALSSLGFSALFGWLIKKLVSPEIVHEFS